MRRVTSKTSQGFTLIELMIVVAIIGILAAIAIPNFLRFQLKSKSSEGKVNLAAIRTAEESYMAEFGRYVPATASPAAAPSGSTKAMWVNVDGPGLGFDQIGWAPEGQVFFIYAVNSTAPPAAPQFTADANADIDSDGVLQLWGYIKPVPGAVLGLAGALGCPNTGTYNTTTALADALATVGPCDAVSGNSVF